MQGLPVLEKVQRYGVLILDYSRAKHYHEYASYVTSVGGIMDYEKMNFLYRKLFQSLKKIDGFNEGFTEPVINEGEIKKLAEAVNK